MIYLDNAATTQVAPEVLEEMLPYFNEEYGNASTQYGLGMRARAAVEDARKKVAGLFGCRPSHIIFTSGGTESNNSIINGVKEQLLKSGKTHILMSAVEHDSNIRAAESLPSDLFDVQFIKPDSDNPEINSDTIAKYIRPNTGLVSVMYVNNETGTVNDIENIGQFCREHGILFASDCVQAAGLHKIRAKKANLDFASVSSHKLHGPKGVGAMFVWNLRDFSPTLWGGHGQERGLRGGTENVPGIVGFGAACALAKQRMEEELKTVTELKKLFYFTLRGAILDYSGELSEKAGDVPKVGLNVGDIKDPGKVLNMWVEGVQGDSLVLMADTEGICISAGSACRSHEQNASRTLLAYGVPEDRALNSIRVSFSSMNTQEEVTEAAQKLAMCIVRLYNMNTECT